jgi:chorismate synthase
VEFGDGFRMAERSGSENSDPFVKDSGDIHTKSNRAGGILGGISTGEPIIIRIAVKPTSSIGLEQETVDVSGVSRKIQIKGRHDPCICPRIVPVAEAMVALTLVDYLLIQRAQR